MQSFFCCSTKVGCCFWCCFFLPPFLLTYCLFSFSLPNTRFFFTSSPSLHHDDSGKNSGKQNVSIWKAEFKFLASPDTANIVSGFLFFTIYFLKTELL